MSLAVYNWQFAGPVYNQRISSLGGGGGSVDDGGV